MAAPRRGPLLRTVWAVHRFVYGLTGGRLGSRVAGLPVLELTTTGRTSGQPRPVLLTTNPAAAVRVAGRAEDVVARRLEGPEREEHWRSMVAANPDYAEYEARTDRPIPVVLLERA
jgi:hypothetical protein